MTKQTFYRNLKKYAPMFEWRLNTCNSLRAHKDNMEFCPLTAINFARTGNYVELVLPEKAASVLGITEEDKIWIVRAADNTIASFTNTNPKELLKIRPIRETLLRSVGLSPNK